MAFYYGNKEKEKNEGEETQIFIQGKLEEKLSKMKKK